MAAKVKIYNLTKQLLNIILIDKNGKESTTALVAKGCVGTTDDKLTNDVARLRKLGLIKMEMSVPVVPQATKEKEKIKKSEKTEYKGGN